MKKLNQLKNIRGKNVIVRVDFNVPMKGKIIVDDFIPRRPEEPTYKK